MNRNDFLKKHSIKLAEKHDLCGVSDALSLPSQVAACAAAALNAASWPFFGVGILDLTMSEATHCICKAAFPLC